MLLTTRLVPLLAGLLLVIVASLTACGRESAPEGVNRMAAPGVQFLEVHAVDGADGSTASALEPRLVLIGGEWRRAQEFSTAHPIATALQAAPGRSLRFSYGAPVEQSHPGESISLRVRLQGHDGQTHEQAFEIFPPGEEIRWRQASIPLDGLGEQEVEVHWSLIGAEEGKSTACAVGEVSLTQSGDPGNVVLLITTDTHRGDHLGAARDGVVVSTPAIDALAERGILFEDCFSSSNLTNPSHIAILTGTHPRDTGIMTNYTQLTGEAPTLAEAFRSAGYLTFGAVSARHLIDSVSGLGQGFDRFAGPINGHTRQSRGTLSFITRWVRESPGLPLFVWVHLFDAHTPYTPDNADVVRYYPDREAAFDKSLPVPGWATKKAQTRLGLTDLRDSDFPLALYRAEISGLDRELGRLLQRKELSGAVIGLTGDHGESLGNHEIYFAHKELYRDTLHVPLVLTWPGAAPGVRCSVPVSNVDLGRTLLDLSGNRDVPFPGRNLVTLVLDEQTVAKPRFSLAAHAREVALTHEGWHFQLRLEPNELLDGRVTRERHQVELYYLPDDPECADDLLEQEFERATKMRGRVLSWLEGRDNQDWRAGEVSDPRTLKNLQAIGYVAGEQSGPIDLKLDPACDCQWCGRFR